MSEPIAPKTPPENFSKMRVFQRIPPEWNYDLHIHSNWSQDNLNGPKMEDYISLAERYAIHIGFADHFELLYYESGSKKHGTWKLNPETIESYLEEVDQLKSQYNFVSSGLEIDYYPNREEKLQEFIDDYRKQFDLLIGSVHEIEDFRPVTLRPDMDWLIDKYKGIKPIIEKYFERMEKMVLSQLFDVIAHPDVIFRFYSHEELKEMGVDLNYYEKKVVELGYLCEETKTSMELNTSGLRYPWKQTFPSLATAKHLHLHGTSILIGSDSHSIVDFENSVLDLRKMFDELYGTANVCHFD